MTEDKITAFPRLRGRIAGKAFQQKLKQSQAKRGIATLLAVVRELAGLTQKQLAERDGALIAEPTGGEDRPGDHAVEQSAERAGAEDRRPFDPAQVSRLEAAGGSVPSVQTIRRYLNACGAETYLFVRIDGEELYLDLRSFELLEDGTDPGSQAGSTRRERLASSRLT